MILSKELIKAKTRVFVTRVHDDADCVLLYDDHLNVYALDADYDEPYDWCAYSCPDLTITAGCITVAGVKYKLCAGFHVRYHELPWQCREVAYNAVLAVETDRTDTVLQPHEISSCCCHYLFNIDGTLANSDPVLE